MKYSFLDQTRNTRAEINTAHELGYKLVIYRLHDEHLVAEHGHASVEAALDQADREYKISLKSWEKLS